MARPQAPNSVASSGSYVALIRSVKSRSHAQVNCSTQPGRLRAAAPSGDGFQRRFRFAGEEMALVEGGVERRGLEQFLVAALGGDAAVQDDADLVGADDGREAVR